MASKKVKSHHPDMERALNPDEKVVTVPKEIQFFTDYEGPSSHHPSAKLMAKPRYLPRQFKNLPSYFQLEPDSGPKSPSDQGCSKTCISVEHHGFLNPMTPEDLLKKYYGDEEFPLGEYDDPPLHTLEKPWETCENYENSLAARKSIQGDTMININTDEPPEYQGNNADRNRSKKVNRSGTGKKKSAKAKKKAAKAKKLAKAHRSSTDATFNKCNAIPDPAEESTATSSAIGGQELVPFSPPPPYEELEPLSDILIKIRIYKPFEQNENGVNATHQNVVTENQDVPDNRQSFCSDDKKSMNKINKGILVMNNELSGDKTSADNDADSFKKWYAASRVADSAKSDAYSWWPNYLECPERFKLFPDAPMDTCSPAYLKNISKLTQSRSERNVGMRRA